MKINYTNGTIDLTKAEAKKAGIPGSDAYIALMAIRAENPTFKVAVLQIGRASCRERTDFY